MNTISKKSRTVALLLALFLGMVGGHRYYLAKPISATLQLLLTISMFGAVVTMVWVIVDTLVILFGAAKDTRGDRVLNW